MASTILDCFPRLLRDNTNERLEGGVKLLQHLSKEEQENGESKELHHILNRLVRGLGSSKISSRKGFYSTLTVYLSLNPSIKLDTIFSIMNNELKASASNSKSEFADINNGRILTCGAIIRSNLLKSCSIDEQKKVLEYLIQSGKQRTYLTFESVCFVVEFLNQLDSKDLLDPLWPVLEPEVCKPLSEQTLDSFYLFLTIQNKFPGIISKKIIKKYFGSENIINGESIKDLLKILTDIPRVICYKHPVYKIFCERLVTTDYIEQFWLGIDECFVKPSKTDEHLGVELFNILLEILKDKSIIPVLLSPNFLKYNLKRFSNNPKHKVDEVAVEFKKALSKLVTVLDKEVDAKLHISVLKKLIFYPGDLMIEKITSTKVIQMITSNLNANGVKKLSNLYKKIAANTKFKEKPNSTMEPWTNGERTYAVQLLSVKLLSHPEIISDHEWRIEQLKFLFNHGLCEVSNVGIELQPNIKESFYRALDHKLPKLDDLRIILTSLINHIDETVFQNSEIKLKTPLDETATEAWKKMIKFVKKLEKDSANNEKISAVFHTMDLHMGLQLFSDPEMAISSINELHSCYEHLKAKRKSTKKNNSNIEEIEEPAWVEVVVDLLLSLLSRKSHLLRSLVNCVFPHICPFLTSTAVHQILDILNVKSGKNPLKASKNGEESDSELESNDEEENEEENEEDEDNSDEPNDEELEEESDSDVEESEVEDETVTDRLRLAVRQALGDATMQTDDEDVDVDKINEEEGKRLDESLAAAFKILKENRKSQMKKQEKSAEALTHFRIRAIDLLETYLESTPSMALALDMLVPLFALLEFAIKDPHQKPLEHRVRTCLKKLSAVKKFNSVEDVDEELLTTILKALIEKGERSASICQEMGDKLAECCVFLVRCSQQTNISKDSFIQIFGENMTAFFKKRDCILPAVLFKSLLQLCWVGNWHLAPLLVDFAFDDSIRSYRRGQALDLLKVFYNNIRMITSDDHKHKRLQMEKKLCQSSINVLHELSASQASENGKATTNVGKEIKQKYVCYLFTLLFAVHVHHIPEAWNWKKLGESMTTYRSVTTLAKDAKCAYNRLCNRLGVPTVPQKKQNIEQNRLSNGNQESQSAEESSSDEESLDNSQKSDKSPKKSEKKRRKNSGKKKEKQKLKKEARELREKAMSEGLESCDFSSVNIPNGIENEPIQNGSASHPLKTEKSHKKRPSLNTSDVPSKKKKKAVQSGD